MNASEVLEVLEQRLATRIEQHHNETAEGEG